MFKMEMRSKAALPSVFRPADQQFLHPEHMSPTERAPEQSPQQAAAPSFMKNKSEKPAEPYRRKTSKVGRNDPCPCGSGKKYKKCCGAT